MPKGRTMADLSTKYMGLSLRNPIIVGSSGLTNTVEDFEACEKYGAGALVIKSIFEEQLIAETQNGIQAADMDMHPEAWNYVVGTTREHNIDRYIDLIENAKKRVQIPIIASVNCSSAGTWTELADRFEQAGADAIELNAFIFDLDPKESSEEIENRYADIIRSVRKKVDIPIALKIGFFFTNISGLLSKLDPEPVDAFVLFNRFMRSTIDLNSMNIIPAKPFSSPDEITYALRWIGLLSPQLETDLCGSGGVHSGGDVIRLILTGASAVQVTSALYINKLAHLSKMVKEMEDWMDEKGFATIGDFKGRLAADDDKLKELYSRVQYMRYIMGK